MGLSRSSGRSIQEQRLDVGNREDSGTDYPRETEHRMDEYQTAYDEHVHVVTSSLLHMNPYHRIMVVLEHVLDSGQLHVFLAL